MAFNGQENAVFIPEFSEISLLREGETPHPPAPLVRFSPPPPQQFKNEYMYSFKSHHDFCSYRIRRPTHNQRGGGGGGGGDTKGHHFFSFQNSQVLQKLNHVVSPPPTFQNGLAPLTEVSFFFLKAPSTQGQLHLLHNGSSLGCQYLPAVNLGCFWLLIINLRGTSGLFLVNLRCLLVLL